MTRHLRYGKYRWQTFIIQVALLWLLTLHAVGLLHKHDTAHEQDACVACQVVSHQAALDLPAGSGAMPVALVLLFLVIPWHRGVVAGAILFPRARSRAPPAP